MAYEVVKSIHGRPYRYRVESYRDPQTGKVRNRWTYLGRAQEGANVEPRRRQTAEQTRERIAEAFIRLIEREDWSRVTSGAIAHEAGIAQGTFYRYFRNRLEVLEFCTQRVNAKLDERLSDLRNIAPSLEEELHRLRAWAVDLVRRPAGSPALFRLWAGLSGNAVRKERHRLRIRALSEYLEELHRRGYVRRTENVRQIAIALSLIQQSFSRRSLVEHELLSEEEFSAVAETFERLVFWEPRLPVRVT